MTLQEYLTSLRHKTVAVIGIASAIRRCCAACWPRGSPSPPVTEAAGRSWALWPMNWRPPELRSIWGRGIWTA